MNINDVEGKNTADLSVGVLGLIVLQETPGFLNGSKFLDEYLTLVNEFVSDTFKTLPDAVNAVTEFVKLTAVNRANSAAVSINKFVGQMKDGGVCCLHDFLDNMNEYFTENTELKTLIAPKSLVDVYVRNVLIDLKCVSFSELCRISEEFISCCQWDEGFNVCQTPGQDKTQYPVEQIATRRSTIPSFETYWEALQNRDYPAAENELHRYFDKWCPAHVEILASNQTDDIQSRYFHYASLNVAIMNYLLGYIDESQQAIADTIRLARQSRDENCIRLALGWLHSIGETFQGAKRVSETDIKKTAAPCGIPSANDCVLIDTCALPNAGLGDFNSSMIRLRINETLTDLDMPFESDLCNLIDMSNARQLAIWSLHGNPLITSVWSQLTLCLKPHCESPYFSTEPQCLSLCHLLMILFQQGRFTAYRSIRKLLLEKYSEANLRCFDLCHVTIALLDFETHFANDQLELAKQDVSRVACYLPQRARLLNCRLLAYVGELDAAFCQLGNVLDELQKKGSQNLGTEPFSIVDFGLENDILMELGEILELRNNSGGALMKMLDSIALSNKLGYEMKSTVGHIRAASIQVSLGHCEAALVRLKRIYHKLLSCSMIDRAKYFFIKAKCLMETSPTQHFLILNSLEKSKQALLTARLEPDTGFKQLEFEICQHLCIYYDKARNRTLRNRETELLLKLHAELNSR